MKKYQAGYTLPELISTIAVTGIFVTIIMTFMFSYWRYGYLLEADLDTLVTRLNAQDYLRTALGDSSGLLIQNSIVDANANLPDPNDPSNQFWIANHAIPGNIPVGEIGETAPVIYYRRPSINTSGQVILNGQQPYEDEFILYMDGTTKELRLRSLANIFAPDNRLATSCPSGVATQSCPKDRTIATDVASIDTKYFSRSANLIDYTALYDPDINEYIGPDFPAVEVLELTINLTKKPVFQKTNATVNSTIIRIALRNT